MLHDICQLNARATSDCYFTSLLYNTKNTSFFFSFSSLCSVWNNCFQKLQGPKLQITSNEPVHVHRGSNSLTPGIIILICRKSSCIEHIFFTLIDWMHHNVNAFVTNRTDRMRGSILTFFQYIPIYSGLVRLCILIAETQMCWCPYRTYRI